ncbi:MAG TPA: DUF433 domain-containing protein [Thermoanaerobaculia bacterium]
MATKAKGIRISDELDREITYESETRGKSWSAMTTELLEEAIRMRRAPGIVFVDGATGRRAAIAGTGLDVWEILATWQEGGRSYEELRQNYPWLTEPQLRAALAYYELYPSEINARLEREAQWTPERVWREFPFSRPRTR